MVMIKTPHMLFPNIHFGISSTPNENYSFNALNQSAEITNTFRTEGKK
jgi:hypothetical protein